MRRARTVRLLPRRLLLWISASREEYQNVLRDATADSLTHVLLNVKDCSVPSTTIRRKQARIAGSRSNGG